MKTFPALAAGVTLSLTGCVGQPRYEPYSGPVAPPQVAYRIDAQRFFEVVPYQHLRCARARLYYTDTARGIHTNVVSWDQVSDGTFIIDAANEQYLVAPIVVSSSGCQTGGGDLCADRLYFSQDAGRTWKVDLAESRGTTTYLTGATLYEHHSRHPDAGLKARLDVHISEGQASGEVLPGGAYKHVRLLKWQEFRNEKIPPPIKPPIDTRFQCNSDGKE